VDFEKDGQNFLDRPEKKCGSVRDAERETMYSENIIVRRKRTGLISLRDERIRYVEGSHGG